MSNPEATFFINGNAYKTVVYKGEVELYDLGVWASEGIERFVGYASPNHLTRHQSTRIALSCLLANGYEIEFACGGMTQVRDREGKSCYLISADSIIRNGDMVYEVSLFDILGMIYW
jgi:hypothetical protein